MPVSLGHFIGLNEFLYVTLTNVNKKKVDGGEGELLQASKLFLPPLLHSIWQQMMSLLCPLPTAVVSHHSQNNKHVFPVA
jgi:hypothetical protein